MEQGWYQTLSNMTVYTEHNETITAGIENVQQAFYNASVTDVTPLRQFERSYKQVHGYLASIVCIFGILFNSSNIYVLTRRNMKHSSINILLTGIAVFDLFTEIVYLPFTIHFHILTDTTNEANHGRGWLYYAIINLDIVLICHVAAMWLTVALATFRYIYVCKHTIAAKYCSVQRAGLTIMLVTMVSILLSVPTLLTLEVVDQPVGNNTTHPWIDHTQWYKNHESIIVIFTFFIFGGVVKTGACVVLIFFTIVLIMSLSKVKTTTTLSLYVTNFKIHRFRADHKKLYTAKWRKKCFKYFPIKINFLYFRNNLEFILTCIY